MPASYKLRLSDGTVLVVDHDGLSTWQVDNKAMVQLVGSKHWRPLKAFLAGERAAARNAARQKPGPAPALPLIPPPPRREEPPPVAAPQPRKPVEFVAVGEPPAPQIPVAEPVAPVHTRLDSKAGEPFPPIPPPRTEAISRPREEAPRQAEPPPSEPDEPLFRGAPPGAQAPRESVEHEPSDEGTDAAWSAEASRRLEEVLPGEPAAPRGTVAPPRAEVTPRHEPAPPPSDPVEPFFLDEPPAVQGQIESIEHQPVDEGADAAWSAEGSPRLDEVPPWEAAAPVRTLQDSKAGEALVPSSRREDVAPIRPVDDAADNRPAASPWSEHPEPSMGAPPNLLVLADDLAGSHSANTVLRPAPDDALPIIRLKPRDDSDEAPEAVGPAAHEVRPWQDARDEKFFQSVASFGGFLSVWLGRLDRLLGRLSSIRPERAPHAAGKSAALEAPPSVRALPKPQVLAEEPEEPSERFTRGSSTPDQVLAIFPPKPWGESQAPQRAPSMPQVRRAGSDPHEPLTAPPPIGELPILRLADIDDPKAANDVYEGDLDESESLIKTAWRWTKRVAVITGLLAGATLAALTSESWLPKAARLGRNLFSEMDKHARSRDQAEPRERARQAAAEQLPHLAPATIELVLSGGILDPPEVFRRASDAVDRGLSALAPAEAQELKALRQELLETLRPEERQRAREYDGARGRRLTLPFEDRDALELVARGARALPPASRVRLQVLSGRAIAVGLVQGSDRRYSQ